MWISSRWQQPPKCRAGFGGLKSARKRCRGQRASTVLRVEKEFLSLLRLRPVRSKFDVFGILSVFGTDALSDMSHTHRSSFIETVELCVDASSMFRSKKHKLPSCTSTVASVLILHSGVVINKATMLYL